MAPLRKAFYAACILSAASIAQAGLVGWITSKQRSWDYIQQTGGIRVQQPTVREGKAVLPVDYDATGSTGVTTRPTVMNSGQAVRHVQANRAGNTQIVITVTTQVVEENSDTGRQHYANIESLPAGAYEVFYETPGDDEKYLGKIMVP